MNTKYTLPVKDIFRDLDFEIAYMPKGGFEKPISSTDINRPALMLTGFSEHFDNLRIQLFGKVEMAYLETLTAPARREAIHRVFAQNVPLVIIARGNRPFPEMREFAEEFGVPLAVSEESTSFIISSLNAYLNKQLCPRITIHGVLVEVYGVGVLLRGDSGIGKSETAIELIKRGHSLVADDAVEIKRVSNITLLGSAPPVIRHFIELRGIGVVDVHNLFGISAVKEVSKIDLVIELEQWVENKHYDRMGLENYTTEILGLNIPMLTVPVRPGRNLAVVVEVAAMNQQQKGLGYNAAKELNERIMGNLEI